MLGVVDLFRDKGTVDELGLGVIRDAFADRLFPGTSTLQSRTRYWLFVPWLYLQLESERTPSSRADERERRLQADLVRALVAGGESEGVIGIEARDRSSAPGPSVLGGPAPSRYPSLAGVNGPLPRVSRRVYRTSRIRRSEGDETELVDAGSRNWLPGSRSPGETP